VSIQHTFFTNVLLKLTLLLTWSLASKFHWQQVIDMIAKSL